MGTRITALRRPPQNEEPAEWLPHNTEPSAEDPDTDPLSSSETPRQTNEKDEDESDVLPYENVESTEYPNSSEGKNENQARNEPDRPTTEERISDEGVEPPMTDESDSEDQSETDRPEPETQPLQPLDAATDLGPPPYYYSHFFETWDVAGDGACMFSSVLVSDNHTLFEKPSEQLKALAGQLREDVIMSALELLESGTPKSQTSFRLNGLKLEKKKRLKLQIIEVLTEWKERRDKWTVGRGEHRTGENYCRICDRKFNKYPAYLRHVQIGHDQEDVDRYERTIERTDVQFLEDLIPFLIAHHLSQDLIIFHPHTKNASICRATMTGDKAAGTPIAVLLDFKREHYSALIQKRAEFGNLLGHLLSITRQDDISISAPTLNKALVEYTAGLHSVVNQQV